MAGPSWGLCRECKWWRVEPDAAVANTTMGLCAEEKFQPFRLRVSGNSGCNRNLPGKPSRTAGASAAPPTAEPAR